MVRRRYLLSATGTASVVALAGCSQLSDVWSDGSSESSSGPADEAEQYFDAAENRDVESANAVLHPESRAYPHEEGDFEDLEWAVDEVTEGSTREYVEWEIDYFDGHATEEEINQWVSEINHEMRQTQDELRADEFSFVRISIENEDTDLMMAAIKDGNDWYVYPDFGVTQPM